MIEAIDLMPAQPLTTEQFTALVVLLTFFIIEVLKSKYLPAVFNKIKPYLTIAVPVVCVFVFNQFFHGHVDLTSMSDSVTTALGGTGGSFALYQGFKKLTKPKAINE